MKLILIFLIFTSVAQAKCMYFKKSDRFRETNSVIWAEVISSNSDQDLQDGQKHNFTVKVLDIVKGPSVRDTLNFSYQYRQVKCPDLRVFKKGERPILFLESTNATGATLKGVMCGSWGYNLDDFLEDPSIDEKFKKSLRSFKK